MTPEQRKWRTEERRAIAREKRARQSWNSAISGMAQFMRRHNAGHRQDLEIVERAQAKVKAAYAAWREAKRNLARLAGEFRSGARF
jgi:hypothetical protein